MGSFILSRSHPQHHFLFEALAVCTVDLLLHADSSALAHSDEMLAAENTADAFWAFIVVLPHTSLLSLYFLFPVSTKHFIPRRQRQDTNL